MSTPIVKPPLTYQFPARPRCTPRRTVNYIVETLVRGLVGGCGFGGFLGIVVMLVIVIPTGIGGLTGWWNLMILTSAAGAILLGWLGHCTLRRDGTLRDDLIVGTLLYVLAGGIIGAPILFLFSITATLFGSFVGAIPGIALWSIYGIALVIFTVRRYSPSMDVAAFQSDARRLAALTTWLSIGPLGLVLYLLFDSPTSRSDFLTALVLLMTLSTITAPFAWWHSKFLIDWWLHDVAESSRTESRPTPGVRLTSVVHHSDSHVPESPVVLSRSEGPPRPDDIGG